MTNNDFCNFVLECESSECLLLLFRLLWLKEGFLGGGLKMAVLIWDGKTPKNGHELIVSVTWDVHQNIQQTGSLDGIK